MSPASKIILHQFPISHFCEKVRLTLTLKGLEYEVKNHVPILHLLTVRRVSRQTQLPVLEIGKEVISDSNRIMRVLDRRFPNPPLYTGDDRKNNRLGEFIQRVDVGVGVHLRRYFYHHVLPNKKLLRHLLGGTDYGRAQRLAFRLLSYVAVEPIFRHGMRINNETAERSRGILLATLGDLDLAIARRKFFFHNRLTAADVTVAALLSPLVEPKEHAMDWPDEVPEAIRVFRAQNLDRPVCRWAGRFYKEMRGCVSA